AFSQAADGDGLNLLPSVTDSHRRKGNKLRPSPVTLPSRTLHRTRLLRGACGESLLTSRGASRERALPHLLRTPSRSGETCLAKLVRRAWGWLRGRLEALLGRQCRAELSRLRAQKQELVAALDAVDDLVVLSYPDGRLRFANRAAASLLEELTGRDREQ